VGNSSKTSPNPFNQKETSLAVKYLEKPYWSRPHGIRQRLRERVEINPKATPFFPMEMKHDKKTRLSIESLVV